MDWGESMRRILFGVIAMAIGCTGSETTAPAATPAPAAPDCTRNCGNVPSGNRLDSASYAMVLVNDQSLPVMDPWGFGAWDYDADAGTWQLIAATLTLKPDGTFTHEVTDRAASGTTVKHRFSGTYTRSSSGSLRFVEDGLAYPANAVRGVIAYQAEIIGTRLIMKFSDGGTFTFEQYRQDGEA